MGANDASRHTVLNARAQAAESVKSEEWLLKPRLAAARLLNAASYKIVTGAWDFKPFEVRRVGSEGAQRARCRR